MYIHICYKKARIFVHTYDYRVKATQSNHSFFPSIKSFVNVFETRFFTYDDTLFH